MKPRMKPCTTRWFPALAAVLLTAAALAGCSRAGSPDSGSANTAPAQGPAAQLRLGYFPNITHAPALIGLDKGFFAGQLGSTKLITQPFNAGPPEVSALLGGSLDAAFIGSSPAINAFAQSKGEAVRVVAGSTSGGAQLVVKPGITTPAQLVGQTVASPQLANTQDVSLKKWLAGNNLPIGSGPGAVTVQNLANPRTLDLFKSGQLAGGWLPEPWSSQLVVQAGATALVDERTLWPGGQFPTTVLLVRTDFLRQHPDTVDALLRGEQQAIDFAAANPAEAKTVTNSAIQRLTGATLPAPVLDRAFSELSFGPDPLASTFTQLAKDSVTAKVATSATDVTGLMDLTELSKVLQAEGKPTVDAAGLDKAQR
jgi:NitT/TauT family transport system substrate-binding protein